MIEAYISATHDVLRLAGQMFLARIDYELRRFAEDLHDFLYDLDRNPTRDWRARFDAFLADESSRGRDISPESRHHLVEYLELWERSVFGADAESTFMLPTVVSQDQLEPFVSDPAAARMWNEIQKEHSRLEIEQRRLEFLEVASKMQQPQSQHEPTRMDSVGEYLLDSGEQLILGDYTDSVTGLGTGVQIAGGLTGLDLPADLRDLSANIIYWENSWSHLGKTALNAVALLPLIGFIKYVDEAAAVAKNANETVDVAKARYAVGPYQELKGMSPGLEAHHVGQQAAMKRLVPGYNPAKAPSILVPEIGHTVRDTAKTISRGHKNFKSARDVIARDIRELRRVYPDIPNPQLQYLVELNKLLYPAMRKASK